MSCLIATINRDYNRARRLSYVLSACHAVVPHRAGLQLNHINRLAVITYSNVEYDTLT